ncbi:MAG TPA: hypothetical protein PKC21_08940 [Oligoflexia bacterium]|nr:hypothetical protein [Oligoflexia bacterium]HMR25465.1 hypothetical protein [Oligoflexia bacterium]
MKKYPVTLGSRFFLDKYVKGTQLLWGACEKVPGYFGEFKVNLLNRIFFDSRGSRLSLNDKDGRVKVAFLGIYIRQEL